MDFYVSVVECDNEFDLDIEFYNNWDSLTTKNKERYIKSAMRLIDKRGGWCGYPVQSNQENAFPRDFEDLWVYSDITDIYFRSNRVIPDEIKKATFEMIKELYNANYSNIHSLQKNNIKSFSDGDMSVSFGDNPIQNPGEGNNKILALILPFTLVGYSNSAGMYRSNLSVHKRRTNDN